MTGMFNEALRWIFWGILYLGIVLVAIVMFLGKMAPYVPAPVRWAMLGVFVWGIVLDARTKAGGRRSHGEPPQDGDLAPVESRNS